MDGKGHVLSLGLTRLAVVTDEATRWRHKAADCIAVGRGSEVRCSRVRENLSRPPGAGCRKLGPSRAVPTVSESSVHQQRQQSYWTVM